MEPVTVYYKFVRLAVVLLISISWSVQCGGDEPKPPSVDFSRQILPILADKCFVCHGPDAEDEDLLRLDSVEGATADLGGYRAIDSEHPQKSQILVRIQSTDEPMPPADAKKQLTEQEKNLITKWLEGGGRYIKHWAYVAPVKKPLPAESGMVIDHWIAAQLADHNISLAEEADRPTLARRVALILTGLPPEPEQLQVFLSDKRPAAYERFVDVLMQSDRYGEHQARYWLDAVRYGDTHGLHLDNRRGIYPYRDWVVRAFNNDLPLNQFITWQLAGDLLPDPSMQQRIATGFVRMNPSTAEGGAIPAEFQAKNNFDRTENLGTVFLGMSLTCARCHNHKYDPVTQNEYYQILAFFNSTAESPMDGNSYTYGSVDKVPSDQAAWNHWQELAAARTNILERASGSIGQTITLSKDDQSKWASSDEKGRLQIIADEKGPFADSPLRSQAADLTQDVEKAEGAFTTTLVAKELPNPRVTRVLTRGEYNLPMGEPIVPDVLAILGGMPDKAPRNRLGLAMWLTGREHPLVARVLVNRIWQRTFGIGLVRTPEDFGLRGQLPTHPELLDWLAVELHDCGWNLKHILRLMVTSRAFKQNSAWRKELSDPENRLWARGPSHRLDAEVLRDIGLWSGGLLDSTMGGEGVKPYQPGGMWFALAHPGSNTKKYVQDKGSRLYRRSLYVYWKRTSPHPMMTLFDAPSRESSCVMRSRTNTPLQSLGLLNETQRVEMARTLAERLLTSAEQDAGRLKLLFLLLASREPSDREAEISMQLVRKMRTRYAASPDDAVQFLSIGEVKRDETLDVVEHAAWTQLSATVLASDIAIMLY